MLCKVGAQHCHMPSHNIAPPPGVLPAGLQPSWQSGVAYAMEQAVLTDCLAGRTFHDSEWDFSQVLDPYCLLYAANAAPHQIKTLTHLFLTSPNVNMPSEAFASDYMASRYHTGLHGGAHMGPFATSTCLPDTCVICVYTLKRCWSCTLPPAPRRRNHAWSQKGIRPIPRACQTTLVYAPYQTDQGPMLEIKGSKFRKIVEALGIPPPYPSLHIMLRQLSNTQASEMGVEDLKNAASDPSFDSVPRPLPGMSAAERLLTGMLCRRLK